MTRDGRGQIRQKHFQLNREHFFYLCALFAICFHIFHLFIFFFAEQKCLTMRTFYFVCCCQFAFLLKLFICRVFFNSHPRGGHGNDAIFPNTKKIGFKWIWGMSVFLTNFTYSWLIPSSKIVTLEKIASFLYVVDGRGISTREFGGGQMLQ